ncbi:MAG: hypothetical protein WC755_04685 [Candidatus Woesearchaeota archaeon]
MPEKRGKNLNPHLIGLILVLMGGIVLTGGDVLMRFWMENNHFSLFVLGIMVYVVGEVLMAFSFKYQNIAVASIMTVIFNILALTLLSYFMFGDKMNTLTIVGMALAIVSVIILEISLI